MESLKGIPLKLLGLELFLRRCPEWVGKIVLIQIGISAHERGDDYLRTRNEVTELVTRINERWPGTIQFQECSESSMKLQQRLALMRAADVAMVTPIRDGLNLTPLVRLVLYPLFGLEFFFGWILSHSLISCRQLFRNTRLLTKML